MATGNRTGLVGHSARSGPVTHSYNPSYLEGRHWEDAV
jgi:hypothetical protein